MKHASKTANHSDNDASTIATRQADPHSHALVLDPVHNCIAYIPDLGCDVIREMYFNKTTGVFTQLGEVKSGLSKGKPDGPRYVEFHKSLPLMYVINELSSSIAVFSVNRDAIDAIAAATDGGLNELPAQYTNAASPTLTLTMIQNVDTVPSAYPLELNTCGRIAVHSSNRFVLVSNRGHDSIAVFRIHDVTGLLSPTGFAHTRGATPRHFQFDSSGQWLICANQDSNQIVVFHFNLSTGELTYSGYKYNVPSPNFVCEVKFKESV
jgi:6-phosphogluconolactonase (cycloisomerase 2 family)